MAWRLGRYWLDFPIWGDEAMVALNLPGRGHLDLLGHLDYCQVAPPLWLWAEKAAFDTLGPSTLSLRLAPLLAGCLGLMAHAWLAWTLFPGRAGALAIGLLAVAIWPVSMSTLIKPYSFDLLAALLLLVPARQAMASPHPARWLLLLAAVAPVSLLGSFPALFVGGAVLVAVLPAAWRGGNGARWALGLVVVTMALGSLASIQVGHNQLESPTTSEGVTTREGMEAYWSSGFPPRDPAWWIPWFLGAMTGQMMAYPAGAANGGSILTFLAAAAGAISLARGRQWSLAILLAGPAALNLAAAAAHRYPFGSSGRLCQFLAPAVCLLAGLGADRILSAFCPRWKCPSAALAGILLCAGLFGLGRDFYHPQRDPVFTWMRSVMDEATDMAGLDAVAVRQTRGALECVFTWRWLNSRASLAWGGELPPRANAAGRVWVFHQEGNPVPEGPAPAEQLRGPGTGWKETTLRRWHYPSPRPEKSPSLTVVMVLLERR